MIRSTLVLVLCLLGLTSVLSGCEQTCDLPIPLQQAANIRILNGVANSPTLLVYVDGKLFDSAYYDLGKYGDLTKGTQHAFGYRNSFLSDNSALRTGPHLVVALDNDTRDTVYASHLVLSDHRQSLVYLGRHRAGDTSSVKQLYLDDNVRSADANLTLARFIQGVPDLSGVDVYFSATAKAKPDLTLNFGEISDANGTGHGTGRSASDYYSIPLQGTDGLLITAHGDVNNVILLVPYPFVTKGFFATIVVRGESNPIGKDPIVSSLVLEDGSQSQGTFNFSTTSFGVRFLNATSVDSLFLLVHSPKDKAEFPDPRPNVPSQQVVLGITPDSLSYYWPLSITYNETSTFFISTQRDPGPNKTPILYQFDQISKVDTRYTFIAIDSAVRGAATHRYGVMRVLDTISLPANPQFGRVRFANTSADHIMNFTFQGKTFALHQFEVAYVDAPLGPQTITVSDGSKSGTVNFTVTNTFPTTVFFMPPSGTNDFPYVIGQK